MSVGLSNYLILIDISPLCWFAMYFASPHEQDARNQLMPGQRRGVTYVSRLQSMQAAIDAQLEVCWSTPSVFVHACVVLAALAFGLARPVQQEN